MQPSLQDNLRECDFPIYERQRYDPPPLLSLAQKFLFPREICVFKRFPPQSPCEVPLWLYTSRKNLGGFSGVGPSVETPLFSGSEGGVCGGSTGKTTGYRGEGSRVPVVV